MLIGIQEFKSGKYAEALTQLESLNSQKM